MDFKSIVGHEDIIKHFKRSIEIGKVGHAYIINGEVDSGKKMLAGAFAKTLNCEEGGTEPCDSCKSCIQFEAGSHPDIIMCTHENPNLFSVKEVREQIVGTITTKPYRYKYKVYIVPDAHLMNLEAQNALLKSIEEPPEYAVIILLSANIDKLLPTVLSRCMVLNTKPIRERDMLQYLVKDMGLSEDRAYFCLDFAQGNLGKAIRLANNDEYVQVIDSVVSVMKKIHTMDVEDLAWAMSSIEKFKLSIDNYMDLMMMWYRDALMLKVTGQPDKLMFKSEYTTMRKQAGLMSYEDIENKINAIATAKKRLDVNANFDVTMELLLLTLKEN
ncbi:MAG: DNA polymerase III subunit delta [Lachnospiraceae bacterium]|nr:DNA polymerase III subunit delta [Lachnospiraceae bacterium]MBQ8166795.1 DNA polymerase III subunit delta [Lachnospiraceae bacterium]